MKKTPNILPTYYKSLGTKIFRDTTALPFADGGPLNDRNIKGDLLPSVYASALGRYYSNGGKFLTAGGEFHKIYKNPEGDIIVNHPKEDKGKWDTINLTEKSGANTISEGVDATKQWHAENPNSYANGGMLKRADGSYSKRGLWDNIRANAGSEKEPTKDMLAQERKINNNYAEGGQLGPGDCGPGLRWDEATQSCVPATIIVEDENDPRYLEYLERQRLYEYSQLPNHVVKQMMARDLARNYIAKAEEPFNAKEEAEFYTKNFDDPEYTNDLVGPFGSAASKRTLTPEEFAAWKQSIPREALMSEYTAEKLADLTSKYPPSKYEIRESEIDTPWNYHIQQTNDQKKWTSPETNFLEDKINREALRKVYPNLSDEQIDKWVIESRTQPSYISNTIDPRTNGSGWILGPGQMETISDEEGNSESTFVPKKFPEFNPPPTFTDPDTKVKGYYPEYMAETFGKNYTYLPIWDAPIPVEYIDNKPMDIFPPGKLEIENKPIIGTPTPGPEKPTYIPPDYKVNKPGFYFAHKTSNQLIPHARLRRSEIDKYVPGNIAKMVQKATDYNANAMEGYEDEEGNWVPGEIEKAEQEGRRINFQGANSLKDRKAQEEYNAAFDAYEEDQKVRKLYGQLAKNMFLPAAQHANGGQLKPDYSLPEDSFQQGGRGLKNSVYASSMGQYPANYAEGGAMNQYPDGGSIYTYAKRPGSYYQKDSAGNWFISNKGTGGQYVPIDDPSGQRTAALNKGAVVTMANPTPDKYSKVTPSYNKSGMVQSVAGRTEAERQPVQDEIAGQQFAQNMERDYAEATKNQLPQHEQPLDPMNYVWQAATGLPTGLKAIGQLAALRIPYTGMTLGTAANTAGAIHGATQIPARVQDWQNVSAGKMDYRDALLNTGLTSLELYGGYNASKTLLPQTHTMQPSVITNPTTGLKQYGNTTLMDYVNLPVKRGLNSSYADASLLPEDQIPYLLPKEELVKRYPWQYMSKDQEILESFKPNLKVPQRPYEIPASHTTQEDIMARALGKPLPTRVSKASLEPKIYYDLNGNVIKKPQ